MMKWSPMRTALVRGHMADLGMGAVRVTLRWSPGEEYPRGSTVLALRRAEQAASGRRLVLAVYSKAPHAPKIARLRRAYCGFVVQLLALASAVNDVVIWNEPNSPRFWRPQFSPDGTSAAAPAYEALLTECWDQLHVFRPGVNVIAASAPRGNDDPSATRPSESPVLFYTELAAAYRASGRDRPIFDTVGHNPYPNTSAEPPWVRHDGGTIGEGDYDKLVQVLTEGFAGTAQPVPGQGVSIWYMEDGFQTRVRRDLAPDYTGEETDRWALDAVSQGHTAAGGRTVDQGTQLADALRLAACLPYVGAFFNFLLADETGLGGWQSGLLWANWQPKPSYRAFARAAADIQRDSVNCAAFSGIGYGLVSGAQVDSEGDEAARGDTARRSGGAGRARVRPVAYASASLDDWRRHARRSGQGHDQRPRGSREEATRRDHSARLPDSGRRSGLLDSLRRHRRSVDGPVRVRGNCPSGGRSSATDDF
jgi:hypothetical protein